jgi:hypothetical protein
MKDIQEYCNCEGGQQSGNVWISVDTVSLLEMTARVQLLGGIASQTDPSIEILHYVPRQQVCLSHVPRFDQSRPLPNASGQSPALLVHLPGALMMPLMKTRLRRTCLTTEIHSFVAYAHNQNSLPWMGT